MFVLIYLFHHLSCSDRSITLYDLRMASPVRKTIMMVMVTYFLIEFERIGVVHNVHVSGNLLLNLVHLCSIFIWQDFLFS